MASRFQTPMIEFEMVDMFTGTLQGQYYTSCSTTDSFVEMVICGERIEIGIKLGKIQDVCVTNSNNAKKPFEGFQNKKENENSMIYSRKGKGRY